MIGPKASAVRQFERERNTDAFDAHQFFVLVRNGDGVALAYETDTGFSHRGIHDPAGRAETRFLASWRSEDENPILCEFLRLLHERYLAEQERPIEPNA